METSLTHVRVTISISVSSASSAAMNAKSGKYFVLF